ncbi:MAG: filamentous hemagglutinin N-terminal domain-containing protein, partial [Verrucomicrobia bacterium]|nr:filamentous hemagglutinin N-terminal domain-containing protein [Verrucomicrobiota bacterium]
MRPGVQSFSYYGMTFVRRWGRRMRSWAAIGLRIFGAIAMLWTGTVRANPIGEQVVGGAASFERTGNTLTVRQGTDRAAINWNSFSIGAGEVTKFIQPSASSIALNRVIAANPTSIYGSLQSNGTLILANPAGIFVGPGGAVNTGGFFGSTRDIDPEAFMKGGDLNFLGESASSIINQGKIEASAGDVFMIAQHVDNAGQIMARDGTVGLISGTQVTLQAAGPGHFKVRLIDIPDDAKVKKDSNGTADVVNAGVIEAANALLAATGNPMSLAINNTGIIQATGVRPNEDGTVTLTGGEGDVLNQGVIGAIQKNIKGGEQGGMIAMRGRNVTAEKGSLLASSGKDGGGQVQIEAKDTTMLAGRVEATGYGNMAKGGRIEALGAKVGLRSGELNADGGAGGGTILVGGDYQGLNPGVANAKSVVMLPEAEISARATANGDGGKVVLWSDDYTGFFGSINTMGGLEGGSGGFVETSSKNNLQSFGRVDASAPKGMAGEWLLDPYDVQIVGYGPSGGGSFNGGNPDIFTPSQSGASIFNEDINRALDSGTSVKITTGSGGSPTGGTISVYANLTKSKDTPLDAPDVALTLQAAKNIVVLDDVTISSTAGTLDISLLADADQSRDGFVSLGAGVVLRSNGGNIVLQSAPGLTVDSTVSIDATMATTIADTIYGGQVFSGDVTIQASAVQTPVLVGRFLSQPVPVGTLDLTQDIVDTVTLLDPTLATTARAGTLNIGSRSGGKLTLVNLSTDVFNYNVRLIAGSGGIVQDPLGTSGLAVGNGMAILDSSGSIGTVSAPLLLDAKRLGFLTEGNGFFVDSGSQIDRLYVQTAGTTVTQSITDLNGNLNYDVVENSGNTTIGGVSGLFVNEGALDFTYINTSTLSDAGNITIGTGGTMVLPASLTPVTGSGVAFGILAVQDPNGPNGVWQGNPGKVTLSCNGTLSLLSERISYQNNLGVTTSVSSGGVFSGGGDISITAKDLNFNEFNATTKTYTTFPSYSQAFPLVPTGTLTYALQGPQFGATLNTFAATQNDSTGAQDFGNRGDGNPYNKVRQFGQISGSGGVLKIGTSTSALGPTDIIFTDPGSNSVKGQMNIGVVETMSMEAKAIQIGSAQTGNVIFGALPNIINLVYTYTNGNLTIVVTTNYTPRYFEQIVPGNIDGGFSKPINPDEGYIGVPHVQNGRVSIVSGTGEVLMGVDGSYGDVNVGGFSVTAIDGIDLQGYRLNPDYMNKQSDKQEDPNKSGSQFNFFSSRVGRSYLDQESSTGGTLTAHFSQGGWTVSDNTQVVTARALMKPGVYGAEQDASGNLAVSGAQIDPLFGNTSNTDAFAWAYSFDPATTQVIFGAPDLEYVDAAKTVKSTQATGHLIIDSSGFPVVVMDQEGNGYLKPPSVQIITKGTPGSSTQTGFQQAGGIVEIDTGSGSVTKITPILDSTTTLGGNGYLAAPEVTILGGGIALGSARGVIDEYGRLGAIATVQTGLGYSQAPTVSITGGGGSGASAVAVVNSKGQLTPYEVNFGGSNYKSTPTIVITDPTGNGCGAIARPVMSSQNNGVIVGIMPVEAGHGYVPGTDLTVTILGGDPDLPALASLKVPSAPPGSSTTGISSFIITNYGAGYTSEPTISLTGGGISPALARAIVDQDPLSGNFGKVVAYALSDRGSGYKTTPTIVVGGGSAVGQFGEVGVRTDNVDLSTGSGAITLQSYIALDDITLRPLALYAPVSTGDAGTTEGAAAISGSVLLSATGQISANYRGLVSTGDVRVAAGGSSEIAFSGDIVARGQRILASNGILSQSYAASEGFPVQIGLAPTALSTGVFSFISNGRFESASRTENEILVFAPAPGQLESLYGRPLNPNLPPNPVVRVSNDLQIDALATRSDFENPVRIDVGGAEGKLSFRTTITAGAEPVLTSGEITYIDRIADQRVYATTPSVIITGGGVEIAKARASVTNGQVTAVQIFEGGDGYATIPAVTISGGGGSGAEAIAVIDTNPNSPTFKKVIGVTITQGGFNYTSSPTITIGNPSGVSADANVFANTDANGRIVSISITPDDLGTGRPQSSALGVGLGYYFAPSVKIVDLEGQGTGAEAVAIVNPAGQITGFTITKSGAGYITPQVILSSPVEVAQASANLNNNNQIVSFTVTNSGGGYASTPLVTILAQGGSGFNLDLDHAGFFSDRFDFTDLETSLITASVVGLGPFTSQRPVNVGTLTPGATSFVAQDVLRFQADALVLGTRKFDDPSYGAGVITVSKSIQADSFLVDTLALAGTRQIRDQGGTTGLSFGSVVLDAGGQVTFTGSGNRFESFAGIITDSGLADGAGFFVSSSNAYQVTDSRWYAVRPLTIGEVLINAPEFTGHRFYQGIETQDGDITVLANDIDLGSLRGYLDTTGNGRFSVNTSTVTLAPLSPGGSVPIQIYYSEPPLATGGAGLTSIQVNTPGVGYTSRPTVTVSSQNGTTATATPAMVLGAINTTGGLGSGYTSTPTLTFEGGLDVGGVAATAEAIVDYNSQSATYQKVIGVQITSQGTGYISQPTLRISGGGTTSDVVLSGKTTLAVQSVTVSGGQSYTSTPTITFSGGGVTDAAQQATAIGLGSIMNLVISNPAVPELEKVRAASIRIGGNTAVPVYVPSPDGCADAFTLPASAGAITLNTDFKYNYGLLPEAPRTLVLSSQGNITLGVSQIPPSPLPTPKTSSIQMPNLSIISSGTVSLGQSGTAAAPNHQVNFLSAYLNGANQAFSLVTQASSLTLADLGPLGGVAGVSATGNINLTAPSIYVPILAPSDAAVSLGPINSGVPSTLYSSGGNINLTSSVAGGKISVAVLPNFDSTYYVTSPVVAAGNITFTADRVELGEDATNVGPLANLVPPLLVAGTSGIVTLQPLTAGTPITLGNKTASGFVLSPAELSNIQGNILRIGSTTAGPILVDSLVTLSTARLTGALSLISGSTIGDTGLANGISYQGGLALSSNGDISFTGTGNDFGTVGANSQGHDITLSSQAFRIATSASQADGVIGITAVGSRVSLYPNAGATPIVLGNPTAGEWGFTQASIDQNITAQTLQIGETSLPGNSITINQQLTPAGIDTLALWTSSTITESPVTSSGISVNQLSLRAGGAVDMGQTASLVGDTVTGNQVNFLAAQVGGDFSFADQNTLTVGSVDGVSGISTGGGSATLTANDMVISQDINTGAGNITLQPLTQATPISLNSTSLSAGSSLSLSETELQKLVSSGVLTIGRSNGAGQITVGTVDLSSQDYDLTLRGSTGQVVFLGGVQLAAGKTFTFEVGSMNVVNQYASPGVNITIPGGKILISSAGSVGTPAAPLVTTVDELLGPSTVTGQLNLRNTQDLTVTGPVVAGGNIYLSSSTGLFQNSGLITSVAGTVTLEGDTMTLGAAITGPAGINLQPYTPDTTIGVFGGAGAFSISNAEFNLLVGTSPVTIGRSNGTGNVEVGGRNPIGRSLTVQSPLLPNVSPGPQGTFTVTGALDTDFSGANINLDAGGGYFTAQASISAGDAATRNGSVRITAQTIDILPAAFVTANGPGNNIPGVYLANGVGGDVYIATSAGALATDLVITPSTLGQISSTGPVSFGRLTNPDGSDSSDRVFVGAVTIGGVGFPFGGLTLLAGNSGSVQLRGSITSNSKPVLIDGPLVLIGNQSITMNNTGTGADLSILNGISGNPNTADLTITMGTGANTLTLAGGQTSDRLGLLTINLGGASLFLGSAVLSRGLNLGSTDSFALPANATLQGGPINLLVQGAGNNLSVQNLTGQQNLTLTTTGVNGAVTAGALDVQSLTISSQGNVTVTGSIQTTTTTSISGGGGDTVNLQAVTAGTGVSLAGDNFVLNQTVTATSGDVSLTKTTLSSPLILGTGGDLSAAGLLRLQAPAGEVILGTGTTGGIQLQGPINLASANNATRNYALVGSAGGVSFSGTGPVLTLPGNASLRISAGTTGAVTGSAITAVAGSNVSLRIDSASSVNLLTDIGFYGPVNTADANGAITLVNAGSVSMNGAFNAAKGNVIVRTLSGNLTLATTVAGGTIQLGAAQNFNNQYGSTPFTNAPGGRTFIYSSSQRYD